MNIPFTSGGPQPAGDPGLYGVLRGAMGAPAPMVAPPSAMPAAQPPMAAPMGGPGPQQGPDIEVQLAGEVVNAAASGQINLPKFLDAIVQIAQSADQGGAPAPMGPQMGGPMPMGPAF